jgi:hypothetical protein
VLLFGHFSGILRTLGVTLVLLCVHEGVFGTVLVCFRKIQILLIDFNDFMQLRGELGATLGALGGDFGVTWGTCGRLWVTFGPILGHIDVEWQV